MKHGSGSLILGLIGFACSNSSDPFIGFATVTFVYDATTTVDPNVLTAHPNCVGGVGQTHIHPSWRNFQRLDMTATAGRWEVTFMDVPVGEHRIRVSDPNVCAINPTGAATADVSANGVTLSRIVDTPGSGVEPGLAFEVSAEGRVTP